MAQDRGLNRSPLRRTLVTIGAALWLVAYGWPIMAILRRSTAGVAGRDGLSIASLSVLGESRTLRLLAITAGQTLGSVVVVVALGVPIGWVLARLDFRGRRLANAVVMVPFVLPTLTVASAVLALVGRVPTSTPARFALILLAHTCLNLGLMVRSVATAVAAVPPTLEQSARSLGRGPLRAVTETTLVIIRPQIVRAAVIVAMFCLTSFGVIVAIGGTALATIEVEVWYLSTRALDLGAAAVLVLAQLLVVIALVSRQRRATVVRTVGDFGPRRRVRGQAERVAVVAALGTIGAFAGGPLGALAVRSLRTPSGWGLSNYQHLFWPPAATGPVGARPLLGSGDVAAAVGYSLAGAAVATVLALILAAPLVIAASGDSRLGRTIDRLMLVPLSISAATLGLGFLLAYSNERLDLRGTWIVVPLVQALTAAPVAARLLVGSVRSLDRSPWEAAAMLGARPLRRLLTVGLPLLRRPIAVAAGFAFAMALGEFGATVFLARNDRPTIPILIGRLLGRPGAVNFGAAMALSALLAVIVMVSVLVADRRGSGDLT
ncbi:MAG: iron ABC transporter permease [Actinobacteria bacterium]|nr:iron ABC transporter permease [Actinomycetota bacterium]